MGVKDWSLAKKIYFIEYELYNNIIHFCIRDTSNITEK